MARSLLERSPTGDRLRVAIHRLHLFDTQGTTPVYRFQELSVAMDVPVKCPAKVSNHRERGGGCTVEIRLQEF